MESKASWNVSLRHGISKESHGIIMESFRRNFNYYNQKAITFLPGPEDSIRNFGREKDEVLQGSMGGIGEFGVTGDVISSIADSSTIGDLTDSGDKVVRTIADVSMHESSASHNQVVEVEAFISNGTELGAFNAKEVEEKCLRNSVGECSYDQVPVGPVGPVQKANEDIEYLQLNLNQVGDGPSNKALKSLLNEVGLDTSLRLDSKLERVRGGKFGKHRIRSSRFGNLGVCLSTEKV
ncbi:hypothetical protein LWI29_025825 [Acer saccharum]|uniref:Uncharacterized protein n=1 Tax=Acer saccharum TaxID=4024 RepID=A0AA39TRF7_ACESA|nr:hypothetical protein LWI29_025825 [Acer saccharum]